MRELNADAHPALFGQDWNDESWAVCKSDVLIKREDADNIEAVRFPDFDVHLVFSLPLAEHPDR